MNNFEDIIARLCLSKYNSLKKTGKPCPTEWTVLSGIVMKKNDDSLTVVSLATGTKCLGANELKNEKTYNIGCRLSDSHAEILARRAFLRYLLFEIEKLLNYDDATSDVFVINTFSQTIEFKNGVSFHFYSSQTPCGDCSIIPMSYSCPPNKIRKIEDDDGRNGRVIAYQATTDVVDVHRTGAKCVVADGKQDLKLAGTFYHTVGPLRTKPGRGDPTLSLSCSDKIAKWNVVGIQGALLSILIPKLRFETIVIGGGCPFSLEVMKRGIVERFSTKIRAPRILQSSLIFGDIKSNEKLHPCPSSVIWCLVKLRHTEVAVEGRKQGATKNKKGSDLLISRRELFRQFLKIIDKHPNSAVRDIPRHPKKFTYHDYKQWSLKYQKSWKESKSTLFQAWPYKPICLQQFVL